MRVPFVIASDTIIAGIEQNVMDLNQTNQNPDQHRDQNRYQRQILLPQIGKEGQARLGQARIMILGCGALGTVSAEQLVRAGIGFIRIVDRDWVEMSNLQRQVLFDEEDARQNIPKAIAAASRLRRTNSSIVIEPLVADIHAGNIEHYLDVDLVLDGTDNVETRYLLNDAAIKHDRPWIYGACVGTEGRVMPVFPGKTACLRCVFAEPPIPGELPTCDTAGVLGPTAGIVASIQAALAIKYLSDSRSTDCNEDRARHGGESREYTQSGHETKAPSSELTIVDLWAGRFKTVSTIGARRIDCPCCAQRCFEFLNKTNADNRINLCGRKAVQIRPSRQDFDFDQTMIRLERVGRIQRNLYFARCYPSDLPDVCITIFPDGRLILSGIDNLTRARSIVARYVGS
jgi:molybdopterin-synthase adenylyltransferase